MNNQYSLTTHTTSFANTMQHNYFLPKKHQANKHDYYSTFGMLMPERSYNRGILSGGGYRNGFNGKEKDDEWTNQQGATYDYGFRIYDSRVARFLSVDPLANKYPMLTPYQFASNRPIDGIDLDGLEWSKAKNGNMVFKAVIVNDSRERKNLYSVRYEMEKQYKAMFGKGYEIQVRVIYDDSKLQVAKDEALVKITNPEEFDKLTTGGDAPLGGRVIRISSNKIDYNGRAFVGTDENGIIYENSIYAEEIGHTGRLEHPFELIEKRGNELQMQGVNLGNFMSYPQKDIKNYPPQNGNVISAEDAIDLQIEWSRNPSPASEGQKAAVKQNYEKGTLNQGEIK